MNFILSKKYLILVLAIVLFVSIYFFANDIANPINSISPSPTPQVGELDFLTLPDNLSISVFAKDLDNPRVIVFDSKGRTLVSEPKNGRVWVLEDNDKNGSVDSKRVLLQGLRLPHGLAFYSDPKTKITYLYVAETHQVSRFVYDSTKGEVPNPVGQNIANLPADGRHFSRTIAFGPNFRKAQIVSGKSEANTQVPIKLYISVGSSCDVCVEDTWKRAAILESDPEGKYTAEFAGGLRNSVFFTFHPDTKEIWATDMGRDDLGNNLPPDEVNIIKVASPEDQFGAKRYGWPFCYGNQVRDKTFNPDKINRIDLSSDCSKTESPIIQIPAHSAPLGLVFVKSAKFPADWQGDLLIAYHGSSNKSEKTGYKIARFKKDANGDYQYLGDLVNGWLKDGKVSGRPVDLKFGPDGALYVSDDLSGLVYRITSAD